jgi:tetratricopeptide (TPR) repeat protein
MIFLLGLAMAVTAAGAIDRGRLDAAKELYGQRRNDEAQAAFEALRKEDPDAHEPWFYLALLAARRDDEVDAVKCMEKAVELNPNDAEYQRRLGDSYGRSAQKAGTLGKLGWARKCRAAYERAVELNPRSIEARSSLMGYYMQAPGIVGGGMDKAHAQADAILQLDPAAGRVAKAQLFVREKKYGDAFALYEAVLRQQPDDYPALYQLGRLAAESGERLDSGLASLQRCLAMTPPQNAPGHAAAHWRIGNIHEKKGDRAAARSEYEAALKLDPKFTQAADSLKKLQGP